MWKYSTTFLSGLSKDSKPTEKIEGVNLTQNSVFREIDTSYTYLFDKENKRWIKQNPSNISGGTVDPENYVIANEQDIRNLWK